MPTFSELKEQAEQDIGAHGHPSQTPPATSPWTQPTTSLNGARYYSPLLGSGQALGKRLMPTFEP